jgi:hypothetical protein
MTNNDKTAGSNTPTGDARNAATKAETTASSKAAARKKHQQLKNQKTPLPSRRNSHNKLLNLNSKASRPALLL